MTEGAALLELLSISQAKLIVLFIDILKQTLLLIYDSLASYFGASFRVLQNGAEWYMNVLRLATMAFSLII